MKKNQSKQLESKLEFLEETLESMISSLENLNKVQLQQIDLINIIKRSAEKDKFKEFIDATEKQISHMTSQRNKLIEKKIALEKVVKAYKDDKIIAEVLENFMTAVGLFE